MTRTRCWLLVLIGWLALLPPASQAQPVQVDAYVEADSLRIGEQTTLWMVVEHSFRSEVAFPEADTGPTLFGDLEVLERGTPGYRYMGAARTGGRIDSVGYTVTTFALDEAEVPALPAWVVTGEDTTIAGSDAFTIPVPSVLPADTTTAMQPLMPLAPFPYTGSQWLAASALVLALLALALWGYMRYRRRGEAEAANDEAATIYEATCTTLSTLAPPEANAEAKIFYTALTQALRAYLAKRLGIPARERTSAEVVHALEQHPQVPQKAAGRIQAVLELADLAKFADTSPDTAANRTALQETKQAVDAIEHALSPPAKSRASATLHDANAPRADHRTPDAASE
ncbi:hypothetical protein CRI93_04965 [Longimonas halophila]|uniref:Protein BatD n=1 Tax=Longimonas halophila TaxID=1469170 RepID=A0A2H3NNY7_9BACT|nr:hypothetical protein [Longimonas halophila]PEN08465.1 hypothetical protein CRI93_04965 [Longimonas halophila]